MQKTELIIRDTPWEFRLPARPRWRKIPWLSVFRHLTAAVACVAALAGGI